MQASGTKNEARLKEIAIYHDEFVALNVGQIELKFQLAELETKVFVPVSTIFARLFQSSSGRGKT